jgi:Ca-activated chloride channel homolog
MRVFAATLVAVLLLSTGRPGPAQSLNVIMGTVIDDAGGTLPGATVELRTGNRTQRTTTTNAMGEFRFDRVGAGSYELRITLAGFAVTTRAIRVGSTALPKLTIALKLAAMSESVMVQDESRAVSSPHAPAAAGRFEYDRIGRRPPPFNTEAYDRIDENGYRRVLDDPLSTFSIDVDTASYANVRRFLTSGSLPPADAVRIEELVNYFRFEYAAPRGEHPFSVTTEVAACPWNPKHRLALIGLQARPIEAGRPVARNLVFLLDVSGSMDSPDKLPLVQSAMRMLVETLTPEDRVAIVVYAGASGLVLDSTPGDRKAEIQRAIAELRPGGSTNGAAGIRLAYDTAAAHLIKGGINRVILATDGDFNVGVTSEGELTRLIEEERQRGIFLSVLGVGTGNLKDSTMEKLADRGNGNYAYLDSLLEARKVLVAEAGGTLVTVAKDVKVQIEFNPRTVGAYRLVGYENRVLAKEDFNNDKKDAGDIGAGHSVTALYEIVPPSEMHDLPSVDALKYQAPPRHDAGSASNELMTVKLRYKPPDGDTSRLITVPVNDRTGEISQNAGFAAAVAEFGMLLRQSEFKGTATWEDARTLARRYRGDDPDGYRAEFIRLVDLAATFDTRKTTSETRR